MKTEARDREPRHVIVWLQGTYADGPVAVTLRAEGEGSFGSERLGLVTEFVLRRRLMKTQKRTRKQVDEIMRKLLSEPHEYEFKEVHNSWGAALEAWNGVGTPSEVRLVGWSCRKPGCLDPVQRVRVAALPNQVILLRCQACGSLRRIDPALPEETP